MVTMKDLEAGEGTGDTHTHRCSGGEQAKEPQSAADDNSVPYSGVWVGGHLKECAVMGALTGQLLKPELYSTET